MFSPKISIILPVYNVEQWLNDTILSIQAQSLIDWEAIFVIDGSPDDSEVILKQYADNDERIKIIKQENSGQGAARNNGVAHAKGDYLFFLDPDDLIPPNALQVAYERAMNSGADIIIGDYIQFKDGDVLELRNQSAGYNFHQKFSCFGDGVFYRDDIKDEEFFYHSLYFMVIWMKLFKRETWIQHRIKAPVGLTMGEDFMTVKKICLLGGRICTVDATLVYYRKRAGSATTLRSDKAFDIFKSFEFTRKLYSEMGLSTHEKSLLYAAYLDWFCTHLIRFTPYSSMVRFYKYIKKERVLFFCGDLDKDIIGNRRALLLTILSLPSLIGFPLFLISMSQMLNVLKATGVSFISFLGRVLPNSLCNFLVDLLKILDKRRVDDLASSKKIVNKIIFHLQKKQ